MVGTSELWTTTDVARYLGVKTGTVSAYRHRGQMPAPTQTLGARTHLWDADVIRAWHAQRGAASPPAPVTPDMAHLGAWTVHGERDLYVNEWVRLTMAEVETPDGERFEHHVVAMKPAAIVALLDDSRERVGLVWRHRFAPDLWGWECVGGLIDGDEDPVDTARRELAEEQGLTGGELRHLVTFEPAVGMVRNAHHVYLGTGFERTTEPTEQNEGGALQWLPLADMRCRIDAGEVPNSGTLVALLYLLANRPA